MATLDKDSKTFGILGIALTWLGFIIVKISKPDDEYANFYAKQGLVLGLAAIAVMLLGFFLSLVLGFFGAMLVNIVYIGIFILWIMGVVNAASGEMKPLPVLGSFTEKF